MAITDAQAALLGTVDQEQTAERPEGLPAHVGPILLVEDQHPWAAVGQLTSGYQAR